MHAQTFTAYLLALATVVSAVPLNINLGAYSPALVVGDGEISFGGAQGGGAENAARLMSTLASGAATAANGAAANGATNTAGEGTNTNGGQNTGAANTTTNGNTEGQKENVIITPAAAEAMGNDEGGNDLQPRIRERDVLPNMDIAPRTPSESTLTDLEVTSRKLTRDLQGFMAALNFAGSAMKNQPKVELGTGSEGSGVGIISNPGVSVPQNSAAAGRQQGGEIAAKRSVDMDISSPVAKREKRAVTIMAIAEVEM
jgi:hypothetical protein